jgi:uncharacterized RDD family membrane protein YckC
MNKYSTTGARIGAAIVDAVIFIPFASLNGYLTETLSGKAVLLILWIIFTMFVYWFYSIFMHGKYGQTLGKMAMGVKIVTYPDELPITFKNAVIRDLPYFIIYFLETCFLTAVIVSPELAFNNIISIITLILSFANIGWVLLEIFSMLFNDKKRAVHDLIAKTVVIRTDRKYEPINYGNVESS